MAGVSALLFTAHAAAAPTERAYEGPTEHAPAIVEPTPSPAPRPRAADSPAVRRRSGRPAEPDVAEPSRNPVEFVVAPTLGLAIGRPVASFVELSVFLGASLPTRARPGNFVALGVQGVYGIFSLFRGHLALHGVAGANGGLLWQVGGGPVGLREQGQSIVGGEVEGRIGYVFTRRPEARVRGTFGVLVRLGASGFPTAPRGATGASRCPSMPSPRWLPVYP